MKAANEDADADADVHGNGRLFVVSGAMPLIFSDDAMLKSELVPVLDEELVLGLGIETASPLGSS